MLEKCLLNQLKAFQISLNYSHFHNNTIILDNNSPCTSNFARVIKATSSLKSSLLYLIKLFFLIYLIVLMYTEKKMVKITIQKQLIFVCYLLGYRSNSASSLRPIQSRASSRSSSIIDNS